MRRRTAWPIRSSSVSSALGRPGQRAGERGGCGIWRVTTWRPPIFGRSPGCRSRVRRGRRRSGSRGRRRGLRVPSLPSRGARRRPRRRGSGPCARRHGLHRPVDLGAPSGSGNGRTSVRKLVARSSRVLSSRSAGGRAAPAGVGSPESSITSSGRRSRRARRGWSPLGSMSTRIGPEPCRKAW